MRLVVSLIVMVFNGSAAGFNLVTMLGELRDGSNWALVSGSVAGGCAAVAMAYAVAIGIMMSE